MSCTYLLNIHYSTEPTSPQKRGPASNLQGSVRPPSRRRSVRSPQRRTPSKARTRRWPPDRAWASWTTRRASSGGSGCLRLRYTYIILYTPYPIAFFGILVWVGPILESWPHRSPPKKVNMSYWSGHHHSRFFISSAGPEARTQCPRISWRSWTPATSPRRRSPTTSSARPPVRSCRRENAQGSCGDIFLFRGKSTDLRISQIWLGAFRHVFHILWIFGSRSRAKKTGRWKNHPLIDVFLMVDVWNHQPGRRSLHSTEWSVFLI